MIVWRVPELRLGWGSSYITASIQQSQAVIKKKKKQQNFWESVWQKKKKKNWHFFVSKYDKLKFSSNWFWIC